MSYLELFALKVTQPLGEFYLTSIPAGKLLEVAFVEELMYIDIKGRQKGNQRKRDPNRLNEIAKYIDSVEMAFPSSIILGANYTQSGRVLEPLKYAPGEEEIEEEILEGEKYENRWTVENISEGLYKIVIPTSEKLASIIDGQHRVLAFNHANPERLNIELPCAIFFDLPNSYQAFLFATINGNQKAVNRSLALEQFGFNVEDEPEKSWTPEKLAVFLSRKLNIKEDSPFYRRIKIAPRDPKGLFVNKTDWFVSMATIVDGILSLITSNPKRDRVEMAQKSIFGGRSRSMVREYGDRSPLRNWFLDNKDDDIYSLIKKYFDIVKTQIWEKAEPGSYIIKTIGVLALFDLLKRILQTNPNETDFEKYFERVKHIDFSDDFYQASGVGRSRIRATLLIANGFEVRSSGETKTSIDLLLTQK